MSVGTLVLWRHGQTAWNAQGRMQGQVDVALDEIGLAQAQRAAGALARLAPTVVVSSDLGRAAQTAAALAERLSTEVVAEPRLRERSFGSWEGLNRDEIAGGWPSEYELWTAGGLPAGVGLEPRADVGARFVAAVAEHGAGLGRDDVLVLVTHGAAISAGITALLGLDAGEWNGVSGIGNCHWSVLHPTRNGTPTWRLSAHNVSAPA